MRIYYCIIILLVFKVDKNSASDVNHVQNNLFIKYEQLAKEKYNLPDTSKFETIKIYSFPNYPEGKLLSSPDEPFIFYYTHRIEEKQSLKLREQFAVYIRAIGSDGKEYRYGNLATINNLPELLMKEKAEGLYRYAFIPSKLFKNILPDQVKVSQLNIQILAIPYCNSPVCAVDGNFNYYYSCK
ncbi:MAG: hypothetical protein IPO72_18195 [Saprospiraceae bacterium]|nr:hypothetical protein [Candidatus Vicinibacter affinis]MBK7799502.1 hypothetical protein [Candidatus Vicinibacter affinis]MBK8643000.1 hypothetical protein [Candidatus Vicinibacter affinis]MBK9643150.1 hypothetical protein [Candidatus Vicinibacter affinis]MBP6173206.1 hypothetical protein [Saprospiraceae bacterium]